MISRRDPAAQLRQLVLEAVEVSGWLYSKTIRQGPWLDLGSGGGIPGLIFACLRPGQGITLLDRRRGRCDFLRRESRSLGLDRVEVVEGEAERVAEGPLRGAFGLVALKAVAEPSRALELARPFLSQHGLALLFQRPEWTVPSGQDWRVEARWVGSSDETRSAELAAFLINPTE